MPASGRRADGGDAAVTRRYRFALALGAIVVVAGAAAGWAHYTHRRSMRGVGDLLFGRLTEAHASLQKADIVVEIVEVGPDRVAVTGCARQSGERVGSVEGLPALAPHLASPNVAIVLVAPGDLLRGPGPAAEAAAGRVREVMHPRGAKLPPRGYTMRLQASPVCRPTAGRR